MQKIVLILAGLGLMALTIALPGAARAAVDWETVHSLTLEAEPLDAAAAPDGSQLYVLTRAGEVVVFDSRGSQQEVIEVGREIKGLRLGPGSETLLLLAPDQRQVRLIELSFIRPININGSPLKGNPAAPVTVVVFSDFQ